jgi:hypothetical protein
MPLQENTRRCSSISLMRNDIYTFLVPLIFKFTIRFMRPILGNTNPMTDLKLSCIETYKWCINIMKNAKTHSSVLLEVLLCWHDILLLINKNYSLISLLFLLKNTGYYVSIKGPQKDIKFLKYHFSL